MFTSLFLFRHVIKVDEEKNVKNKGKYKEQAPRWALLLLLFREKEADEAKTEWILLTTSNEQLIPEKSEAR